MSEFTFLLNLSTTATLGTEEHGRCRAVAVSRGSTVVEKSIECEKNVLTIELTVSYFRQQLQNVAEILMNSLNRSKREARKAGYKVAQFTYSSKS